MRYSLGQNLADFGFAFLEKIHEPIFLLHRRGKIAKINEAGRKFLSIAHLTMEDLEKFLGLKESQAQLATVGRFARIPLSSGHGLHLIVRRLPDCDFVLVEMQRRGPA